MISRPQLILIYTEFYYLFENSWTKFPLNSFLPSKALKTGKTHPSTCQSYHPVETQVDGNLQDKSNSGNSLMK